MPKTATLYCNEQEGVYMEVLELPDDKFSLTISQDMSSTAPNHVVLTKDQWDLLNEVRKEKRDG